MAVGACVTLPPLSRGQLALTAEKWPGTDQAQLDVGLGLYKGRCSKCHWILSPAALKKDKWEDVYEEMAENAELKPEEKDLLQRYLWALTVEAPPDAPDAGTP